MAAPGRATAPPARSNGTAPANGRPNGADLRRSILDQARLLLLAEGYQNLSMRRIARAAGCSATSIYLHFDDKDALVHALIDEGMGQLHDQLESAESGLADPDARLEAMSRAYVRFGLENAELYEAMFLLHPEQMARYPAEKYRRARRALGRFAGPLGAPGSAGRTLTVDDPEIASSVLWASLHGAVSLLLAHRIDVRIDREGFVEATIQHALAGLRSAPASA